MDRELTRRDRLRRVVLLCCHFTRNLAYYRVGRPGEPRKPNTDFWVTVNGNFIDQCVLEWCKLLGDTKAEHYCTRIVSDPVKFEAELLHHLGITAAQFEAYRIIMREYRDKFVAHLDSERVMNVPAMDTAKASIEFYHGYVGTQEAISGDLANLPSTSDQLIAYYQQCTDEAARVYGQLSAP